MMSIKFTMRFIVFEADTIPVSSLFHSKKKLVGLALVMQLRDASVKQNLKALSLPRMKWRIFVTLSQQQSSIENMNASRDELYLNQLFNNGV